MSTYSIAPVLQLHQLAYAVPTTDGSRTVLQDVNLTITRGEWLGIAGTNGSGKSTLAKIIAQLAKSTTGEVNYNRKEADASMKTAAAPRPFVQMIFQNPDTQMIGETVYDDVCFGLDNYGFPPADRQRLAMQALDTFGLAPLADTPAHSLSGGQKQLLHAAGCIAVEPEILVFDEATAMLDPMSRQQLLRKVRGLHQAGTTIIWITQLMDELAECDRIVALDSGRLVFDGTKAAFFYDEDDTLTPAACKRLGFTPPYAVQVAQELKRRGVQLADLPFTIEQLGKAVDA